MSEDIAWINKQLVKQYGTTADKRPIFRVILSDNQTEKRRSNYTGNGIFLGRWNTVVRETLKYPYLKGKYVLEMYLPVHGNPELVTKTTYEPLYVFQDKDGNPLPPLFKVAKYVIDSIKKEISSKSSEEDADKKKQDKEIANFIDYFEDIGHTTIGSHIATGSGVFLPGDKS